MSTQQSWAGSSTSSASGPSRTRSRSRASGSSPTPRRPTTSTRCTSSGELAPPVFAIVPVFEIVAPADRRDRPGRDRSCASSTASRTSTSTGRSGRATTLVTRAAAGRRARALVGCRGRGARRETETADGEPVVDAVHDVVLPRRAARRRTRARSRRARTSAERGAELGVGHARLRRRPDAALLARRPATRCRSTSTTTSPRRWACRGSSSTACARWPSASRAVIADLLPGRPGAAQAPRGALRKIVQPDETVTTTLWRRRRRRRRLRDRRPTTATWPSRTASPRWSD